MSISQPFDVNVIGYVSRIPKIKYKGIRVYQFSMANNQYKEEVKIPIFMRVTVFGASAETCQNNFYIGKPIQVTGTLTKEIDHTKTSDGENKTQETYIILTNKVYFLPDNKPSIANSDFSFDDVPRYVINQVNDILEEFDMDLLDIPL